MIISYDNIYHDTTLLDTKGRDEDDVHQNHWNSFFKFKKLVTNSVSLTRTVHEHTHKHTPEHFSQTAPYFSNICSFVYVLVFFSTVVFF